MAPTGPPELACNSWGQLGAPLVAWAWLWGCPTPPCSQIQWAPQLVAPNGLATLMAMAQGCAHGLCTSHTMHSVPLGTCVLLEIEKLFISDNLFKENKSLIEDLIIAAHNNAKNNLKSKTSDELSKITGGFGIPGFKWPL